MQDGEESQQAGVSKQESKQKAARKAAKESQKSEAEAERQRRAQLELLLMDEQDLKDASKIGACGEWCFQEVWMAKDRQKHGNCNPARGGVGMFGSPNLI